MKQKFIHNLYEIVIYVFPILLLFFILVGFQLWKLESKKEKMIDRLNNSTEIIDAARNELISIKKGLNAANDSMINRAIVVSQESELPESVPNAISKQGLVELSMSVLNQVDELKNDAVNYYNKPYVIKKPSGKYYTVIISYSELGYAIIQREHLKSLGFTNVKILIADKHYALSIEDASEKTDFRLHQALEKWNENFKTHSDAYIRKF